MSRGFGKRGLSKKVSDSKDFTNFIQSAAGPVRVWQLKCKQELETLDLWNKRSSAFKTG
jgi:hypothetical protein